MLDQALRIYPHSPLETVQCQRLQFRSREMFRIFQPGPGNSSNTDGHERKSFVRLFFPCWRFWAGIVLFRMQNQERYFCKGFRKFFLECSTIPTKVGQEFGRPNGKFQDDKNAFTWDCSMVQQVQRWNFGSNLRGKKFQGLAWISSGWCNNTVLRHYYICIRLWSLILI